MADEKSYKPRQEFDKDLNEPLIDLDLMDSAEVWLIQWPMTNELDFDEQEVSLKLHQDGSLGSFTGSSGKAYEMVSYKTQDVDAAVFVSSESQAKIGSHGVFLVHYLNPSELAKHDPSKDKEERDRELYERTIMPSRGFLPSVSRSTHDTNPHGRSNHTNLSCSNRPKGVVSQAETPSKCLKKRPSPGSRDKLRQDSKRSHSGLNSLDGCQDPSSPSC